MKFKVLAGLVIAVLIVAFVWFMKWLFVDNYPRALNNQQIIEQTKYCEKNGLKASRFIGGLEGYTVKIECQIKS